MEPGPRVLLRPGPSGPEYSHSEVQPMEWRFLPRLNYRAERDPEISYAFERRHARYRPCHPCRTPRTLEGSHKHLSRLGLHPNPREALCTSPLFELCIVLFERCVSIPNACVDESHGLDPRVIVRLCRQVGHVPIGEQNAETALAVVGQIRTVSGGAVRGR